MIRVATSRVFYDAHFHVHVQLKRRKYYSAASHESMPLDWILDTFSNSICDRKMSAMVMVEEGPSSFNMIDVDDSASPAV